MVNIQKPFAHPEKVLEYLSRYVFRIAISDRRIEKLKMERCIFQSKIIKEMEYIAKAKELLLEEKSKQKQEVLEDIKNYSKLNCPVCKKGRMCFAGLVPDVPPDF